MKSLATILVVAFTAAGTCPGQSPSIYAAKAKADFEKVDAEPIPAVADALACAQSNAAALPVLRPDERYLAYYRKGYCELFAALPSGAAESFQAADRDFTEAIASWPRKSATRPPGGLRALTSIARLEQGRMADAYPDMARELTTTIAEPSCAPTPLMTAAFCNALIDVARTWLGWLAYRNNDLAEAARVMESLTSANPPNAWALWISGRLAQQQNHAPESSVLYEKALAASEAAEKSRNPDAVTLPGPKLDVAALQYQIALSDYAGERYDTAIGHLDATIKASPRNSYAIFLRARSKDALHLSVAAMEDYALAVQTARAGNDAVWNVGQASYFLALLLYQAKDYARAETEFANALSGRLGEIPPADVKAWQSLTGLAARGCKASSLDSLEAALSGVSAHFPKQQAEAVAFDCHLKQASTLDQYIALDRTYASRLDAARRKQLHLLIANMYADQGVAAEDRKDPYTAVIAYRHATEWNPANSKAHFNLGAIYIEDKRYNLAEAEFRALVDADPNDYEAHYWLAESILAQHPAPARVTSACALLQRSLSIQDPARKADFAKAMAAAKCAN